MAKKPKSSPRSAAILNRFKTEYQPRRTVARLSQIYHEKQRQQHCAIHCINNLLQFRLYSHSDFERLADEMYENCGETKKGWFSSVINFFSGTPPVTSIYNFKAPFGAGNYDANVLLNALCVKLPFEAIWFNKGKQTVQEVNPEELAGIILNRPVSGYGGFISSRHWVSLVPFMVPCTPKNLRAGKITRLSDFDGVTLREDRSGNGPPRKLEINHYFSPSPYNENSRISAYDSDSGGDDNINQVDGADGGPDHEIPSAYIPTFKEMWFNLDPLRSKPQAITNLTQYLADFCSDRDSVMILVKRPIYQLDCDADDPKVLPSRFGDDIEYLECLGSQSEISCRKKPASECSPDIVDETPGDAAGENSAIVDSGIDQPRRVSLAVTDMENYNPQLELAEPLSEQ